MDKKKRLARYATAGVVVGAAIVATPLILGAAGFTSAGVLAGSTAASVQSAAYGGYVASGSVFAVLQSVGAAGIGAKGVAAVGALAGGAAMSVAYVKNWWRPKAKL